MGFADINSVILPTENKFLYGVPDKVFFKEVPLQAYMGWRQSYKKLDVNNVIRRIGSGYLKLVSYGEQRKDIEPVVCRLVPKII